MNLTDIVMKLNGRIEPVGDSAVDSTRLVNLKSLCSLVVDLLERIESVASATDDHLASVKAAKDVAATFLKECLQ